MTSTLTKPTNGAAPVVSSEWSDEEKKLIKSQIAPGASDNELRLFQAQCRRTGLDPFSRQIYAIMRESWDPATRQSVSKMTIQTSIDGFRVIAQRSGKYAGQDGPYWCGPDGEWKDVWLSPELPAAAKVLVFHRDFDRPIVGIALFAEYASKKRDGSLIGLWKKGEKPSVMLAKCAEALAFRKAFPNDLSGLYTSDEMSQADSNTVEVQVSEVPEAAQPARSRRRSAAGASATTPAVTPAQPEAPVDVAPVEAAPAPDPEPVAAAPAPEPVQVVEEPVQAAPEAPVEVPQTPEAQLLRVALGQLSEVGVQALLLAYQKVKGFADVTDAEGFYEVAKPQAQAHLAGLTAANITKLNQGLHPTTGAVLVQAEAVGNDPANPFG